MTRRGVVSVGLVAFLLLARHAQAAEETQARDEATGFDVSASVYAYFVPESSDYLQPTVAVDHGALHLEARYSYENLLTGSTWVGYNLSGGGSVTWNLTPMLGAVFGRTNGVAPGVEGAVGWWKLELSAEGEYVVDFGDRSESFLYVWSELTLAPLEWFWFGIVTQRTRTYSSGRELERGLLAGVAYGPATLTGYWFNPDDAKPVGVIALGVTFDP